MTKKLNPDALEDLYDATKAALADIDRTGYATVCRIVEMQIALAKAQEESTSVYDNLKW